MNEFVLPCCTLGVPPSVMHPCLSQTSAPPILSTTCPSVSPAKPCTSPQLHRGHADYIKCQLARGKSAATAAAPCARLSASQRAVRRTRWPPSKPSTLRRRRLPRASTTAGLAMWAAQCLRPAARACSASTTTPAKSKAASTSAPPWPPSVPSPASGCAPLACHRTAVACFCLARLAA